MPRKKTVLYEGVLAKPLPRLSRGMLRNDEKWIDELVKRLDALVRHYDIPIRNGRVDWPLLVLRLAFDHVEGFQLESEKGRPRLTIQKMKAQRQLLSLREQLPEVEQLTEKDAAKWFARHPKRLPEWYQQESKRRGKCYRWNTLRSELRSARDEREWLNQARRYLEDQEA